MLSLSLASAQFRSIPDSRPDERPNDNHERRGLLNAAAFERRVNIMKAATQSEVLPHFSCHGDAETSILLIHGAFSSPDLDWSGVIASLPHHHLLVPCLSHLPLSLEDLSERLATLIRAKAHGQRAHVYGVSMGSQIALQLAASYPDECRSLIISGYRPFKADDTLQQAVLPYFQGVMANLSTVLPTSMVEWVLQRHKGRQELSYADQERLRSPSLAAERPNLLRAKQMVAMLSMAASQPHHSIPYLDRVLIIAATKGNFLWSSNDSVDDMVSLGAALSKAGEEQEIPANIKMVKGRSLRNPWHISNPTLCADVITAFLDKSDLPEAFEVVLPSVK